MKKFLATLFACTLAFTTCFAVVGCGGDGGVDGNTAPADADDAADADATEGAGEEGVEDTEGGEADSA